MRVHTPQVSVIVPNYNHAQYLEQRLDSVLNQTFDDFELIVLDDASSDDSLEVIKLYKDDPRIQLHLSAENSGNPFIQWNKGLILARGRYVWIAESDDYADPLLLRELVAAMDRNPNVGLAYCQSWVVGSSQESNDKQLLEAPYGSFTEADRWKADFVNSGAAEIKNYLVYKNTIPNASAVLFRKTLVSDGVMAPEEMRLAGDWMFWTQVLSRSDIAYIAKPLNYFRAPHSASQREKTKRQCLDLLEGLEVYAFIEGNVQLTDAVKRKCLQHQVKLWSSLAFERRLSWDTNRAIYSKLLSVHPEILASTVRSVAAPFLLHYLTAPARRTPSVVRAYKGMRQKIQLVLGTNRTS